ncbi:MAG: GNAT family N-acetyltransferase [Dehalococcoidia bacterium]|nr:GNAT family N-acetyltransferase [Dehalococcoidia bacterium]
MRLEAPLDPMLVKELFKFWEPIFGGPIDVTPETLLGSEGTQSRITVFTRRLGDNLAGACLVASSSTLPALGGLGEVATSPEARRTGIATELTKQAVDDFADRGGQALFLGTVNHAAARIYFRLGWRKLAGANLMVNVLDGRSPEEFMVDYFRGIGPVEVSEPSPADRAPMIPLLVSPHDWQALDFNTGMMSTRYAVQDSCLGLYRRYAALTDGGRGVWFCASDDEGQLAGLSSARVDDEGGCQVDGFTRRDSLESWRELVQRAADWGGDISASSIWATVSVEDDEKLALFESAGFKIAGEGESFDLGGRELGTLRIELA